MYLFLGFLFILLLCICIHVWCELCVLCMWFACDLHIQLERKCNKKFDDLNGRNAMMQLRCARHGVLIGRHMIKKGEGVNDIFSPIYCYWRKPPKIAISDFMCVGLPYGMSRDVKNWKGTLGALDEFHGAHNHFACSIAWSMQRKKDCLDDWFVLKDQGCEQRNRNLSRFKQKGSWMRIEPFMLMTAVMFAIDNRLLMQRFCPNGFERECDGPVSNWWYRLQQLKML